MAVVAQFVAIRSTALKLSNSLLRCSSRPGRPPKRGPVGLSLPASHLSHHSQLKKHRMDNGEYPYENGHMSGKCTVNYYDCYPPLLANARQEAVGIKYPHLGYR